MKRTTAYGKALAIALLTLALLPGTAFASNESLPAGNSQLLASTFGSSQDLIAYGAPKAQDNEVEKLEIAMSAHATAQGLLPSNGKPVVQGVQQKGQSAVAHEEQSKAKVTALGQGGLSSHNATDKLLPYDRALIDQIGTQEKTGHTICCSSFSCAYADAVMDGTVHDHSYYTCSECRWTDWGGGGSSFRNVGSDEQVLREAYDQITAGKPTVVHVAASYGEHWIALIGYQGATDPDHLTLGNFIALDPWDGAQITASDMFRLYGDGCQHVTER